MDWILNSRTNLLACSPLFFFLVDSQVCVQSHDINMLKPVIWREATEMVVTIFFCLLMNNSLVKGDVVLQDRLGTFQF